MFPGQSHSGTFGLFDDPDEIAATTAQAEAHEVSRLEGQIRRQERRDRRLERKEEKAARRIAVGKSASRLPAFVNKILGRETDFSGVGENGEKRSQRKEYVIVRKPPTPEPVYTAEDVDPVDSPWLRECGMVRVKSQDPGVVTLYPRV